MAKRPTKHGNSLYDDGDFQDNDMMAHLEEDDMENFDNEDFKDDQDFSDEEEEEEEEEEERPRKSHRKKSGTSVSISRKRTVETSLGKEVRLKAFWGIYSQNMQCVETFEYSQKEAALKKAAELEESKKMLFFVKLDKKVIES